MKYLVLLALGFASVFSVEGLIDSNTTVSTPCGNITNLKRNFGTIKYIPRKRRVEIRCSPGYTFAARQIKRCNVTSGDWIDKGVKLTCKPGNGDSCPKLPKNQTGICVTSCSSDTNCTAPAKKCCSNGCGYSCVTSVAPELCPRNSKRLQNLLNKDSICSSADKRAFCGGFFENVASNCLKVLLKKLDDFIGNMEDKSIRNMMRLPTFRKNLCRMINRFEVATISKLLRGLPKNELSDVILDLELPTLLRVRSALLQRRLIKLIINTHGKDGSKWPAKVFENRGIILAWLNKRDLEQVLKNPSIKAILAGVKLQTVRAMWKRQHVRKLRLIFNKFASKDCSSWTGDTLTTLNNFLFVVRVECFSKITSKAFCAARTLLANNRYWGSVPNLAQRFLRKVLIENRCNGKALDKLTSAEIEKNGWVLCGIDSNVINNLKVGQMSFDIVEMISKCPRLSKQNKLTLLKKIKDKVALKDWTKDNLKKAWRVIDQATCKSITQDTFTKFLDEPIPSKDCQDMMALSSKDVLDCARKTAVKVLGEADTWKTQKGCRLELRDYTDTLEDAFKRGGIEEARRFAKLYLDPARSSSLSSFKKRQIAGRLLKLGSTLFQDSLDTANCKIFEKYRAKLFEELQLNDDSPDAEEREDERSQQIIPRAAAACIVNLYKKHTNIEILTADHLANLGPNLCKGISQSDVTKMDLVAVNKAFSCIDLPDSVLKRLSAKFKELKGEVDSELVCQLKQGVLNLGKDILDKLPVDPVEGCSWVDQAGKADPRKFGIEKIREIAILALSKMKLNKISQTNVVRLGSLVIGLTKDDIKTKIEDEAVIDAIKIFVRYYDEKNKELAMELIDRLRSMRPDKKLTEDDVCDLREYFGTALLKDDYERLETKTVKNAKSCIFRNIPRGEPDKETIRDKLNSPSSRRRRATDASFTAEQVLEQHALMSPDQIKNVQHSVYVEAAQQIGERKYTPEEKDILEAWAHVAKNGDASKMETSLIQKLGAVCRGLTADNIGKLNFADDETIQGCSQEGLSKDQINKGLAQIKKKKGDPTTAENLLGLGYFAIGLTPSEIESISTAVYTEVYDSFNKMNGWSEEQLVALKKQLVKKEIKGPISGWQESDFTEANVVIGGFTKEEIESLSIENIQAVPAQGIKAIPPSKMGYFSTDQLNALSPAQSNVLTDDQKNNVKDCKKTNFGCPTDAPPDNHASQVTLGTVTVLMTVMVTMKAMF